MILRQGVIVGLPYSVRVIRHAVLVIASAALALFAADVVAWSTRPQEPQRQQAAQALGVPFDKRDRARVVADFRADGVEAYPKIPAERLLQRGAVGVAAPFAGVPSAFTVDCNEDGSWSTYVADAQGFRNPQTEWNRAPIDVLLIGDSFAAGACVGGDADIASRLRHAGLHVVTLGVHGAGPLTELATLMEYGQSLKPKVVVWLYFEGNDPADLNRELEIATLAAYLDGSYSRNLLVRSAELATVGRQFIAQPPPPTSRPTSRVTEVLTLAHLGLATRTWWQAYSPTFRNGMLRTEEILRSAKQLTKSWNGEMLFIYHSTDVPYRPKSYVRRRMKTIVEGLGITWFDFDPVRDANADPLSAFPLRIPGHYSARGYQLMADQILDECRLRLGRC